MSAVDASPAEYPAEPTPPFSSTKWTSRASHSAVRELLTYGGNLAWKHFNDWAIQHSAVTVVCVVLSGLVLLFSRLFFMCILALGGLAVGYLLAQDTDSLLSWPGEKDGESNSPGDAFQLPHSTRGRRLLTLANRELCHQLTTATTLARLEAQNILNIPIDSSTRGKLSPRVQGAVSNLIDLILRDFIDYWYDPLEVSRSGELRRHVRYVLTTAVANFSQSMQQDKVNLAVLISYAVANTVIVHLREYRQFEVSGCTVSEYLKTCPDSLFHHLANHEAQVKHLLDLAHFLLGRLLPARDRESPVVFALMSEIMATSILEPMVMSLCDPDRINMAIVASFNQRSEPSTVTTPQTSGDIGKDTSIPSSTAGLWQKIGQSFSGLTAKKMEPMTVCIMVLVQDCQLTVPKPNDATQYFVEVTCPDLTPTVTTSTLLASEDGTLIWNERLELRFVESSLQPETELQCTLRSRSALSGTLLTYGTLHLSLQDVLRTQRTAVQHYALQHGEGEVVASLALSINAELLSDADQPATEDITAVASGYAPLQANDIARGYEEDDDRFDLGPGDSLVSSPTVPPILFTPTEEGLANLPTMEVPADIDLSNMFPLHLTDIFNQGDGFVEFMQYLEDKDIPPYLRFVMNVDSFQRFAKTLNDPDLMRDDAWSIFHMHFTHPSPRNNSDHSLGGTTPPYLIPVNSQAVLQLMDAISRDPSPDCFQPMVRVVYGILKPHFARFCQDSPLYQLRLKERWAKFVRTCQNDGRDPLTTARATLAKRVAQGEAQVGQPSEDTPDKFASQPCSPTDSSLGNSQNDQPASYSSSTSPGSEILCTPSLITEEPIPVTSPVSSSQPSTDSARTQSSVSVSSTTAHESENQLALVTSTIGRLREQIVILNDQLETLECTPDSDSKQKIKKLTKLRTESQLELQQMLALINSMLHTTNGSVSLAEDGIRPNSVASHRQSSTDEKSNSSLGISRDSFDPMFPSPTSQILNLRNVTVSIQEEVNNQLFRGPARMAAQLVSSLGTRDSSLIFTIECEQNGAIDEGIPQRGWMITRSYADFAALHSSLKQQFAKVEKIKFPHRNWASTSSGEGQKQSALANGLQHYLSMLLVDQIICASRALQLFMKPDHMTVPRSFLEASPVAFLNPGRNSITSTSGYGAKQVTGTNYNSLSKQLKETKAEAAEIAANVDNNLLAQILNPKLITQPATQAANATSRTVNAALKSAGSVLKMLSLDQASVEDKYSVKGLQRTNIDPSVTTRGEFNQVASHAIKPQTATTAMAQRSRSTSNTSLMISKSPPSSGIDRLSEKLHSNQHFRERVPSSSPELVSGHPAHSRTATNPHTTVATSQLSSETYASKSRDQPPKLTLPTAVSPVSNKTRRTTSLLSFGSAHSNGTNNLGGLPSPLAEHSLTSPNLRSTSSATLTIQPATNDIATDIEKPTLAPEDTELLIETFFAVLDEAFDLNDRKQWLRRKALAVLKQLLRQSYSSTVSGAFVDMVHKYGESEVVAQEIEKLTASFWPDGIWYSTPGADLKSKSPGSGLEPRTLEQKEATKLEARVLFVNNLPETLQRMVGDYNGVMGMTRLFELLQYPEITRPIVLKLLDGILKLVLSGVPEN
ncbi:Sorting nexin-20 [Dispira simplex]|nr:Sorting nexin-20 [Dispira simplex]